MAGKELYKDEENSSIISSLKEAARKK